MPPVWTKTTGSPASTSPSVTAAVRPLSALAVYTGSRTRPSQSGGGAERVRGARSENPVAGADLVPAEPKRTAGRRLDTGVGEPVHQLLHAAFGIWHRAGVHAEDAVRSQRGHQPGHGPSRAHGDHDVAEGGHLVQQLAAAVHVTEGTGDAGSPVGDQRDPLSLGCEQAGRLLGPLDQLDVVRVGHPDDVGAEELVQGDVARGPYRRRAGEDEAAAETESRRRRGREPGVVALGGAAGDERRGAGPERLGAEVLELAHLVAASAEPGEIVALDPQVAWSKPQQGGQPGRRFERCRPGAQWCRPHPIIHGSAVRAGVGGAQRVPAAAYGSNAFSARVS